MAKETEIRKNLALDYIRRARIHYAIYMWGDNWRAELIKNHKLEGNKDLGFLFHRGGYMEECDATNSEAQVLNILVGMDRYT